MEATPIVEKVIKFNGINLKLDDGEAYMLLCMLGAMNNDDYKRFYNSGIDMVRVVPPLGNHCFKANEFGFDLYQAINQSFKEAEQQQKS